jgi:SAM-dependent methyltransferase
VIVLGEDRYILSADKGREAEALRFLRIQESFVDPVTIRHLEAIGVAEGWKCLEVGAGAGSIGEWLSKRVGAAGKVVATDVDIQFLVGLNAPNITVRQHNILKDDLEKNEYDLVHCRKVLHHLPQPERAAKRMMDAVRPGGWLLLEEDDWGSMRSATVTDPYAAPFIASWIGWFDSLRKRGIADYYFGRCVRGLVERLGLMDVGQEGWTCMMRGGDPLALMYREGVSRGENMIAEGILTREQYETIQRGWMDPSLNIPSYTLFSAWGRRPLKAGGT